MANKIKLLPDQIINQIAAGEVIDRPASIVKELVENSLDAQARTITVEIEQGGRRLVRVIDDGSGMSREDALLCLERHATSKIGRTEDLFAIVSFGFRGEALPSIASVSEMTVVTREPDNPVGALIQIDGGKIRNVADTGAPPGTDISIKRLFKNVPARRKFLKSVDTEMGHIATQLSHMALARPDVSFTLTHNGRTIFDLPASSDLSGRLRHALGADAMNQLIPVDRTFDHPPGGMVQVHGYVSAPSYHRSSTRSLHIFVNRRFVRDRLINHAVFEAYRNLMPKGKYPLVVLFVDLPAEAVDVNVHPAKHEVRFREQNLVHDCVIAAISDAIRQGDRRGYSPGVPAGTERGETLEVRPPASRETTAGVEDALRRFQQRRDRRPDEGDRTFHRDHGPASRPAPAEADTPSPVLSFRKLRVIGQAAESYIVAESEDSLILIDQHAAHERIAFERILREFHDGSTARQPLLFPVTVELSFQEARRVELHQETLARLGLVAEPFGGSTVVVKELPALLAGSDPEKILLEVVDKLGDSGAGKALEDRLDEVFSVMACHSVVRAHKPMSLEEMRALLTAMEQSDHPGHCPHGRDVVVRIPFTDLGKWFGR